MCGSAVENRDHLFCSYSYAKQFFTTVFGRVHGWPNRWDISLQQACKDVNKGGAYGGIYGSLWSWTMALIWKERCSRSFGGPEKQIQALVSSFKEDVGGIMSEAQWAAVWASKQHNWGARPKQGGGRMKTRH
ncbi:unnamed protein product [Linum trigynum]|uniref:Uncharacterized protein n=1 Tax=Linum trigynum TaxID=586398 RepID=A0AAV2EVL5_9ROSI